MSFLSSSFFYSLINNKLENYNHDIDYLLLTKYLSKETSAEENERVLELLATSPANKKYYEELLTIWNAGKPDSNLKMIDAELAWEKFLQRRNQTVHIQTRTRVWPGIAAVSIILLGLAFFGYRLFQSPSKQMIAESGNTPVTDTLPDASVITLNKNSTITYPSRFTSRTREVKLSGEAFFDITENKEQPFIVDANGTRIKVVGTSFNVKSNVDSTEVIVETGVVIVEKNGEAATLYPKDKLIIHGNLFEKQPQNDQLYKYYRTKQFTCDNTPLWKLVSVLNEAYQANIIINNKDLKDLELTSSFNNESLDQVLNVISLTFNIRVIKENNRILLR